MKIRVSIDLDYPVDITNDGLINICNDIARDSSVLGWMKDQWCYNIKAERLDEQSARPIV